MAILEIIKKILLLVALPVSNTNVVPDCTCILATKQKVPIALFLQLCVLPKVSTAQVFLEISIV